MTQPVPLAGPFGRRTMLRTLLIGGLGMAAPGLVAGCSTRAEVAAGGGGAAPVAGGTVTWGKAAEAISLDPPKSSLGSSWDLFQIVYDPLVELDDTLQVVPGLAESWETPSPTEYVFTLRADATFSNGRPLTADDVVGTFGRHLDPEQPTSFASFIGGPTTRVTKVDERTVRFTLEKPRRTFLSALSAAVSVILPMKEYEAGEIDLTTELLGTGPFMVETHEQDRRWVLAHNPHAWRKPAADTLVVDIMPDTNARMAALRDGSIDLAEFGEADAPQLLAGVPDVAVEVQDRTDFYLLTLNPFGDRPFADARVRQAIAHGIDRDQIQRVAFAGTGEVTGVVSATFDDAIPSTIRHDPEKAKALLAEAGHPDLRFEIIYGTGDAVAAGTTQMIQQNLAEIGVTVTSTALEEGVWAERAWTAVPAEMDATITYYAAYAGPLMAMRNWHPTLAPFAEGFQENDPEILRLITQAWEAPDDAAADAAREASAAIDAHANSIPLVTIVGTLAYRSDKVLAKIPPQDGNVDPMRHVADLSRVAAEG